MIFFQLLGRSIGAHGVAEMAIPVTDQCAVTHLASTRIASRKRRGFARGNLVLIVVDA
jgi:hypothetical protein